MRYNLAIVFACLLALWASPGEARQAATAGYGWGSWEPGVQEARTDRRHRNRSVPRHEAPKVRIAKGNVHSKAGAWASVAPQYAAAFQALVDDLEAHGAVIRFMGGYRHGRCGQATKHPCGMALDICQYGRSVVERKCQLPGAAVENAIAEAHGLFHGARWCNPDRGHFESGRSVGCGGNWATVHHGRPRHGHFASRT